MKVMKITTEDGRTFYNADHGPSLIKATLERLPNWKSITLINMSEKRYWAIPATNQSAELWRVPHKGQP